LKSGTSSLRSGAVRLDDGAAALQDGADQLDSNSDALRSGADVLAKGADSLTDGVARLTDGSRKLHDGISQFRDEGIDKITELYDNDITRLVDRLEAIVNAGKDYSNYSGIAKDMDGSVRFIIRTDSIGTDDDDE